MSAIFTINNEPFVCIIGAGPGGLSAARALKSQGIQYEQFERHSDVGGVWDINNVGSPMYESAHFISSRAMSGFSDFPMPVEYPDYPNNQQILAYVRSFAQAFDLYKHINFGVSVKSIQKTENNRWVVTLDNMKSQTYDAVICATGCNWDANLPEIQGSFNGEIRHSVTYKRGDEFKNKRVMIVGAGNSGADISCDAAIYADKAFISMRRGYHFIPKHIFGVPADEFSEKGPHFPLWLQQQLFKVILKFNVGKLSRFGLPKPDHKLFESHPLMNTQLLHYLQHGDISVRPDIDYYDGDEVVFKNGHREKLDLVLYATGYKWSVKYGDEYFEWQSGRPQMYLSIFNRKHKNLFGIGYIETNSSAFKLFDMQAHLIASYLREQNANSEKFHQFNELIANDYPDLSGGVNFIKTQRHAVYLEAYALKIYISKIYKHIGFPALKKGDYIPMLNSQYQSSVEPNSRPATIRG
ncbi:flavin-containing monooxygenase [Acinetobacter sp. WZC-1]|uniref:flavin-containing monooxygenase n=1 Tax=Acinetobacter sp. WZC-1 TaxID=3459034 RepID=UPI00403E2521